MANDSSSSHIYREENTEAITSSAYLERSILDGQRRLCIYIAETTRVTSWLYIQICLDTSQRIYVILSIPVIKGNIYGCINLGIYMNIISSACKCFYQRDEVEGSVL